MTAATRPLARALGIVPRYTDQTGERRTTGVDSARALIAAMGVDPAANARDVLADLPEDLVVTAGAVPDFEPDGDWTLTFENGAQREGRGALPALPLGIHRLETGSGARVTLLAAPPALPLPPRCWGLIAPLYGLSATGVGSYGDLGPLLDGLGALGAGFLGLNPVHAGFPCAPEVYSPYTPSHRRRLNALHLVRGSDAADPLIDYAIETPARAAALDAAYAAFEGDPAFDAFVADEGAALQRFALHQALSERHGAFWNSWPAALRDPESAQTRAARAELGASIRRHAWFQWRAEEALSALQARARAGGMAQGLYLDLAVGTHPDGAETWEDAGAFALGASLGAPPDAFSADGQNWQLAPFNPLALRRRAYAPLAETLRRQLRVSGLLRIDHILGFERAFWVPQCGAPGAYVTMPRAAMLAVVRIEAARAGAAVVGEDLGNIPKGLQGALREAGIMGCRVAMFERSRWKPPVFRKADAYDEAAIASFSTHDLPTWDGWLAGADIAAREAVGDLSAERASRETAIRATESRALVRRLGTASVDAMHRFLAATPARLVAVQVENTLGMQAQPNLPGTTTQYPNWRQRLPVAANALCATQGLADAAAAMAEAGRSARPAESNRK
ncbi:4-alpha-glucanotransferase [Cognatishimia sp. F0-27]|uniref:4-alpha-glucanotransferase n=1 Tax=Cognatishimia sp. F0-27 TaxID=2816855 RepID=UPI001D0BF669|nr:4-alpha-glucanotransferase [Cognatishimia sp. F0-27]MCC1493228.1 4-alpha-glucanotransferase [Cognatishimia sp. F0-27]